MADQRIGPHAGGLRPPSLLRQAADVRRADPHSCGDPLLRGDAVVPAGGAAARRGRPAQEPWGRLDPDTGRLRPGGRHHRPCGGAAVTAARRLRRQPAGLHPRLHGPGRSGQPARRHLPGRLRDERPGGRAQLHRPHRAVGAGVSHGGGQAPAAVGAPLGPALLSTLLPGHNAAGREPVPVPAADRAGFRGGRPAVRGRGRGPDTPGGARPGAGGVRPGAATPVPQGHQLSQRGLPGTAPSDGRRHDPGTGPSHRGQCLGLRGRTGLDLADSAAPGGSRRIRGHRAGPGPAAEAGGRRTAGGPHRGPDRGRPHSADAACVPSDPGGNRSGPAPLPPPQGILAEGARRLLRRAVADG